jgi:F-box/leucine-rich repeat protein 12
MSTKRSQSDEKPPTTKKLKKSHKDSKELTKNDFFDPSKYSFSELPHEILLDIFKLLDLKNICRMSRICRKWRSAAYDQTLWSHVDLSESWINVRGLHKIFHHGCFVHSKSVRICGNVNKNKTKTTITKALMERLNHSCPNLKSLELNFSDVTSLSGECFFSDLHELKLVKCEILLDQFKSLKLDNLTLLDLSGSSRICASHLTDLQRQLSKTLRKLVLKSCYRVDDKAVEVICEGNFLALVSLDLEETGVTSVGIHLICTRLKGLTYINVKNCKFVLDSDREFLQNTFLTDETFKLVK